MPEMPVEAYLHTPELRALANQLAEDIVVRASYYGVSAPILREEIRDDLLHAFTIVRHLENSYSVRSSRTGRFSSREPNHANFRPESESDDLTALVRRAARNAQNESSDMRADESGRTLIPNGEEV